MAKTCMFDGCDQPAENGQVLCYGHWLFANGALNKAGLRIGEAPVPPPMPTVDDEFRAALSVEDTRELPAVDIDGKVR